MIYHSVSFNPNDLLTSTNITAFHTFNPQCLHIPNPVYIVTNKSKIASNIISLKIESSESEHKQA